MKKITGRLKPFKQILQTADDIDINLGLRFSDKSIFEFEMKQYCEKEVNLKEYSGEKYNYTYYVNGKYFFLKKEWLTDIKEEVDWSKVPIDTKCVVWDNRNNIKCRHYAGMINNLPNFYDNGVTSWSTINGFTSTWNNYELYKESDE